MEIYFNPYPGAASCEEEGTKFTVLVADALFRLNMECGRLPLSGRFSGSFGDLPPSKFIIIRNTSVEFGIRNIFHKTPPAAREKLRLLLEFFSKGQVIEENTFIGIENWIVSAVGTAAPVLELAAKNNAIALTIPTESEWRTDLIKFENRSEVLHNLWGQDDISLLADHCVNVLENSHERFSIKFNAKFCDGALNTAPKPSLWDQYGFFQNMQRAKVRNYFIDDKLLKNVGHTNYGVLLELRCHSAGQRIFLVHRAGLSPEILISGFYQKGIRDDSTAQNNAIDAAIKRINNYKD